MNLRVLCLSASLALGAPVLGAPQQRAPAAAKAQRPALSAHEREVASITRGMLHDTLKVGGAAQFNLLPTHGIEQELIHEMAYGHNEKTGAYDNRPERIQVSRVKDGLYHATFLGSVSAHDFGQVDATTFKERVMARVAGDKVRVSYDYGPGTPRVMVADLPSEVVTRVDLKIPLKEGMTRVIYDRVDRASNRVVGSAEAYAAGRIEEIMWDGK